jgi:2-keto-4-pentenoate hydratase/2-oxohepta-3-ene-1,7-dioic acid hydratase in catechol pathway
MRLGTYQTPGVAGWRPAVFLAGDRVLDLPAAADALAASGAVASTPAQRALLAGAPDEPWWLGSAGLDLIRWIAAAADQSGIATPTLADIVLGPPLTRPRKFIAAGRNYMDHLREGQKIWAARGKTVEKARHPTAFAKYASAIVPSGAPIVRPAGIADVDYEVELAVVIGRPALRVPLERALDYVAGYTICNDVAARGIQRFEMEHQIGITMAKNFPSFAPLGPWLVTADEIPDPQTLRVQLLVNGEARQDANTSDMIFPIAELVSYWSALGLEIGDMIITGTPAGVALARPNPEAFYLKPGDIVEAVIERIGTLRNPVQQGEA